MMRYIDFIVAISLISAFLFFAWQLYVDWNFKKALANSGFPENFQIYKNELQCNQDSDCICIIWDCCSAKAALNKKAEQVVQSREIDTYCADLARKLASTGNQLIGNSCYPTSPLHTCNSGYCNCKNN